MSASPVINGLTGAHEQPVEFGRDTSGPYVIRRWRGTHAAIYSKYNECVLGGGVSSVKEGYGVHELTARFAIQQDTGDGTTETPINNWEFFASHVEKDILEADIPAIESLSANDKTKLRNLMQNPPATSADIPSFDSGNATTLYGLIRNGLRSIRVNAPALRHTQTVSNQYTVRAALTNVGKILSSSTLATVEAIPTSVLFNMPADSSNRAGLAYGWMKLHPTVRVSAKQKLQIEQEWEYGLWPTIIYGTPL